MAINMKAWVQERYGPPSVLELRSVPKPTAVNDGVLVRVKACSVNAGDWHLVRGTPWFIRLMFGGWRRPGIPTPGMDVSGVIEAVGAEVRHLRVGDAVMADLSEAGFGAFAEYACAPERVWAHKPDTLGYDQAAALPAAAMSALQGLRDCGHVQAGERVLIRGAASGVGSFAVQIARLMGAEVTASCRPEKRAALEMVGVTRWFEDAPEKHTTYDVILDMAAFGPLTDVLRWLKPGGRYVLVGGDTWRLLQIMLFGPLLSRLRGRKVTALAAKPKQDDLRQLAEWVARGELKPVLDQCMPFDQLPKALEALEQRQIVGKRVLMMNMLSSHE